MSQRAAGAYVIRDFASIEELRECVELQEETWGQGFSERVSPAILKVSQILGGVAAGAYDGDGTLVGFVFGMTGVREGEVVHWSDMLAVRRGLRDRGLGRELKAYQRAVLLERGVTTMYWTFDPLQSRNAYLNFAKLGIVARDYARDMYGQTDSPLHRGIGTDRFVALWLMDSERVAKRLGGEAPSATAADGAIAALGADLSGPLPRPGALTLDAEADCVTVAIPSDVTSMMGEDTALAVAWREATRAALTHYMGRGWEVREFLRGPQASRYLLASGPLGSGS